MQSITASISELDLAVEKIRSEDDILRGELTLLVRQFRSVTVDCIVAFRKKYPGVTFRIFYTQTPNDLNDYDYCISCTPPNEQYHGGIPLIT